MQDYKLSVLDFHLIEDRMDSLKGQTLAAEEIINRQEDWKGAKGCGELKGQNIPRAPGVGLEQQSCITRKHLRPTMKRASVYQLMIDTPFYSIPA